jgi:putative transcriptional regulator
MTGSIPNRLRDYRTRARLTQQQLADKAGAARVTIARAESGTQEPTLDLARRLAAALDCGLDDLFGDEARGYAAGFHNGCQAVLAEWRRENPDTSPVARAIHGDEAVNCGEGDTSTRATMCAEGDTSTEAQR